jgi:putative peptidoglycan lipid II flippase
MVGLRQRGSWQPSPGWVRFLLQVVVATALLGVFLAWSAGAVPWVDLRAQALQRVLLLGAVLAAGAVIYFGALWVTGVKLRQFMAR